MWFDTGWHKFGDSKWMDTVEATLNFRRRGLKMTPKPVIAFDWYRAFSEFLVNSEAHIWLSKTIVFGEFAVALGLILGAFTGIAAFFGGLMNWNFIMAGSASTNGPFFAIATWLVLAWRKYGLDRARSLVAADDRYAPGNREICSKERRPLKPLDVRVGYRK
jgi:thiosulfate dehydrogenase [quinone] large subunit